MPPLIRSLERGDALTPGLAALMQEMQEHYEVSCPPLREILVGIERRPPGAEILIAMEDGAVTGFAAYSGIYPGPYLQPGLFLKELYVSRQKRGSGTGLCLMRRLAGITRERGLSRIDWTADPANPRLLAFYDRIGGSRKLDKLFYRLDGSALAALSEG